jgi:ATP-dependent Clp protease ATP-binding subunit ClpC
MIQQAGHTLGFTPNVRQQESNIKDRVLEEAKKAFRPEFLNRFTEVVVFNSLTRENLMSIVDVEVAKVNDRLKEQNMTLLLDEKAKTFLLDKGTDLANGARPLRRAIEQYLENPLSSAILQETVKDIVMVSASEDALVFQSCKPAPAV